MHERNQEKLQAALKTLQKEQQYRTLPCLHQQGRHVLSQGRPLLNIASNDYLGLGMDSALQREFFCHLQQQDMLPKMSATSSRLLTGNDNELMALESELGAWYTAAATDGKSALVFNSGYHANIGILPALTALPVPTLILADKLVHASIIDGIHLCQNRACHYRRYRHNDDTHLAQLIAQAGDDVERIIIVTESIFSMDGDRAHLDALVALKRNDNRIELYVDEAHAVGVLGNTGLGLAEETQTLAEIDYLVGTFGKAFASVGAYIFCSDDNKAWLINQMRSLIFSTALPPINHAWTRFILAKMPKLQDKRAHLADISQMLSQAIPPEYQIMSPPPTAYQSPIIAYVTGDNAAAVAKAKALQDAGFYALPIRPPTVPKNTARIRLVMNAAIRKDDCQHLIAQL